MLFYETSAKTGKNIVECFRESCSEIDKRIESNFYDLNKDSCGIKLGLNNPDNLVLDKKDVQDNKKKKKCCN